MPALKADVWASVLEQIQGQVGEPRFSLWFKNVQPTRIETHELTLGVPNLFVQEWLQKHFLGVIQQCVAAHTGIAPAVRFVIDPQLFRQSRKEELAANADIIEAASTAATAAKPAERAESNLRPDFTLDRFVVGPSNKLAHACVMEILDAPSSRMHPLFIHSLSGLGKTHLMQGLYHELRARDNGRTVEYVSAETFTNQYVYAMRTHRLDAFRNRFRNVDVLLVDDVHYFCNKSGSQDELLHTYDAIDSANKQLVLASDVHPKMLVKIKQHLLNRFASGMIVRMAQPDFSTRVAILKGKLHQNGRRVPDDVLRAVARGFGGSVRELTGAMTTVLAYASLTGEKIDVAFARRAMARLEQPLSGVTGIDGVERVVARHYGITSEELRAKRLARSTRLARQMCMYLARTCTPMSCREIAQHFGAANHSTVVFAIKRIEEDVKSDANLRELVVALTAQIRKP